MPTCFSPLIRASCVLTLLATLLGTAHANEALARKNDCVGCHSVASKLVGPAFKDVASKYAGQDAAAEQLQSSIRNGSAGKWGEIPMPAHPKLSAADAKKLVTWVLNFK